jgi:hypothetical protein
LVVGAVVTFVDTTNRKHREMEANHGQRLEAAGRLAAGIAHEINTAVHFVLPTSSKASAPLKPRYVPPHRLGEDPTKQVEN